MMDNKIDNKFDITEEDIRKVKNNSVRLPFEKIMSDLKIGKMPAVEPIILSNGYGVGISLDYYKNEKANRNLKHLYISNPNGNIDPAIADYIASRILGEDFIFIEPMSTKDIFHYMKENL